MHLKIESIVGAFIIVAVGIFFYMSFQIGSMRLDLARYAPYKCSFKDVAGLAQKADVKIAGVKVGWVDGIYLRPTDTTVELTLKILKEYPLYNDAQAIVRQEGLLGVKFLEIVPGNAVAGRIAPGGTLPFQTRQFVSLDEIFYTFKRISQQVEKLSNSFQDITDEAEDFIKGLKKRLEPLDQLMKQVTRGVQITTDTVAQTAQQVSDALESVRLPVEHLGDFARKVKEGEGSLGKIVNDTRLYEDIKDTAAYAQGCVERFRKVDFIIDNHAEILPNSYDDRKRTNIKWYFESRIFPCRNFFGLLGFVYSHQGFARREELFDCNNCISFKKGKSDAVRLQLQGGVWWRNVGIRAGLFDGTAGVGIDWCLPFERLRWMTTFEAFDFRGHNRFNNDRRPHLKWLNRLLVSNNLYLTFGADDFISKCNKSAIIGFGGFFSTCDLWRY